MLTKKGLNVIAKHIRTMMNPEQRLNAATAVASACAELNPRFDPQKFFEACNVTNTVSSDSSSWQNDVDRQSGALTAQEILDSQAWR